MGYVHGSNLILIVGGAALGHSSTCQISNKADTKERSTKEASNAGKWNEVSVSKLNVEISAEGFVFEPTAPATENGYDTLLALWEAGEPITCKYALRGEEATKYREGLFVITDLQETAPADDDATYSISLKNSGQVETKVVAG